MPPPPRMNLQSAFFLLKSANIYLSLYIYRFLIQQRNGVHVWCDSEKYAQHVCVCVCEVVRILLMIIQSALLSVLLFRDGIYKFLEITLSIYAREWVGESISISV